MPHLPPTTANWRDLLAKATRGRGRRFWRSLDALAGSAEFRAGLADELLALAIFD